MRGQVSSDLDGGGQGTVVDELPYRAAVAFMGVDADHLDGISPPPGLLGQLLAQPAVSLPSNRSTAWSVAVSTIAVTNQHRRLWAAEAMAVLSNPTRAVRSTPARSPAICSVV